MRALDGQFGLRAKVDLAAMTVLGQYVGVEYLEDEFHAVFSGTQEDAMKNIYAFTLSVGDDPTNSKMKKQSAGARSGPKIVIDPLGLDANGNGLKPMVMMLNDCRTDISKAEKTKEDERAENVLFAKVSLNGWPSIFVITKRDIKAGEELLGFYGNDYWDALKAKELQQRIANRTQNLIDNSIIRGTVDVNSKRVNLL